MNANDRVIKVIADFLDLEVEEVTADKDLKEDLGADSLDFAELVMSLEEEFDFEAPESELMDIKTVGDIISYIESKQ